jgi:4-amino-4-deoxy-L-arabinose transferase-like glycosyltransferase
MLTDVRAPALEADPSHLRWRTIGVLVLCAIWIITGLLPHQPWKPDEAYTFGLVLHVLQTGDWVVPTLAGEPFLDRPPAYLLAAAALAAALGGLLEAHDAARLASGGFMAVTLGVLALTARELYGREHAWVAPLALIGCVGLLVPGHQLIGNLALLAGFAVALYGLALARRRGAAGGVVFGTGLGLAFLAQGLLAPTVLAACALLLPLVCPQWRSRSVALALACALAAALPWLTIWPLALHARSPELFAQWLWVQNIGRLPGAAAASPAAPGAYLLMLLWYAWPALPLAGWMLWHRGRAAFDAPQVRLPLLVAAVCFLVLPASPDARELYALPLLLPLALLATASIDSLDRSAANFLDWFGIATFGLCAAALWMAYLALQTGVPGGLARELADFHPGFSPRFDPFSLALAATATLAWIGLVARIGRSNRRAIINWAAGLTLSWILFCTFFLAYVDHGRAYRGMVASLQQALPADRACVASRGLGESQRAMLHYYADLITVREEAPGRRDPSGCDLLLWQGWAWDADALGPPWRRIWEGSRAGDRKELYRLYVREAQSAPGGDPN